MPRTQDDVPNAGMPEGHDPGLTEWYRSIVRGGGRSAASRCAARLGPGGGVHVAPSTLPGAGRGLFADRDFAPGDWVTGMDGAVFGGKDAARRNVARGWPASHLRTLVPGAWWLDGLREDDPPAGAGGGSYANDARGPGNNARLVVVRDAALPTLGVVFLRATRAIPRGAEVCVSYGRGYWRRVTAETPPSPP